MKAKELKEWIEEHCEGDEEFVIDNGDHSYVPAFPARDIFKKGTGRMGQDVYYDVELDEDGDTEGVFRCVEML